MPTKKYSIKWILDDSQAQAAYKRGVKGLAALDSGALKAAVSIEAAFARAGRAVDGLDSKTARATAGFASLEAAAVKAARSTEAAFRRAGSAVGGVNARTASAAQGFSAAGAAASRAANRAAHDFGRSGRAAEAAASQFGSAWARESERVVKFSPMLLAPMARLQIESSKFGQAFAGAMTQGQLSADRAIPAARLQLTRTRVEAVSLGTELAVAGNRGARAFDLLNQPLVRSQTESVILEEKLGGVTKAVGKTEQAMGGFLGKMIAIQAARAVFGAIMNESQRLEQYWEKLAENAGNFRDSLRELASLKGQPGPNDTVTADVLDLASKTGMVPEKAAEFSASYENIGPTIREKGHYQPKQGTAEQLEKDVVAETGRTARRLGVDEKAAGEAIGTAGLFHTFNSVEQAMEQFGSALKGLSEGKLAYGKGVAALNKGSAKLLDPAEAAAEGARAGKIGSFAEAGVYLGALSLGTGTADQAQNRMVQNSRVLNPDVENVKGTKALKNAGLTDQMTDPQKLIQLSKYLKAQKVASPRDWLSKHELGTVATREGMEASLKVADVLEQRLKRAAESATTDATGKATVAENRRFMATDRSATAAAVASKQDVVNKAEGIRGPEELEKAKRAAELRTQLSDPDFYHSRLQNITMSLTSPLTYLESGVSGWNYQWENDRRFGAIPTMKREAERVGADLTPHLEGLEAWDYRTRARAFTAASEAVRARGGDPLRMQDLDVETQRKIEEIRPPAAVKPAAVKLPAPAMVPPQAMNAPAQLPPVFPETPRPDHPALASGPVPMMGLRDFMAANLVGSLPERERTPMRSVKAEGDRIGRESPPDLAVVKDAGAKVAGPLPGLGGPMAPKTLVNPGLDGRLARLLAGKTVAEIDPRGGQIGGGFFQTDLRTNAERAAASVKARPEGWISSVVANQAPLTNAERLMPNKPRGADWISSAGSRAGVVPLPTVPVAGASTVEKETLDTLKAILTELKGSRPGKATAIPAPLPVGAPMGMPRR